MDDQGLPDVGSLELLEDGRLAPGALVGDLDLSLPVTEALLDLGQAAQFTVDGAHCKLYIAQCIVHCKLKSAQCIQPIAQDCYAKCCLLSRTLT